MAIADGVRRSGGGADASALAINTLITEYYGDTLVNDDVDTRLMEAAQVANRRVSVMTGTAEEYRATTTLVAAAIDRDRVWVVNAGDSRAYLVSNGEAELLTRDHTVVQELLDIGAITHDEALHHPEQSMLTRVLGMHDDLQFDSYGPLGLQTSDRLLLCSDGLSSMVTFTEIAETATHYSPQQAVMRLIEMAIERGGYDNISVVVAAPTGLSRFARWRWGLLSWIARLR